MDSNWREGAGGGLGEKLQRGLSVVGGLVRQALRAFDVVGDRLLLCYSFLRVSVGPSFGSFFRGRAAALQAKTRHILHSMLIMSIAVAVGCDGSRSKTTDTDSSSFVGLSERRSFLERYVSFRRTYEELEFDILFMDGGDGRMPGPSEWDIRISAKIPADEIDQWISSLEATEGVDSRWVSSIPNAPTLLEGFQWYGDGSRIVAIDAVRRIVLYRNHAH